MLTRREFIKIMGVLGTFVLSPVRRLGRWSASEVAIDPAGELFSGFILLPEGAPIPEFVIPAQLPQTKSCGMVEGLEESLHDAFLENLDTLTMAKDRVSFPLYDFDKLPGQLRQGKSYILSNDMGDVYRITVRYEFYDRTSDSWVTALTLWVDPDFPRPYPLWASEPVEPDGPAMVLEKVNFLPSPGVRIVTQEGFACFWIESDALYTLIAEPSPIGLDASKLVELLAPVS